jgi:phage-related protein (TIGR01555 family)
MLNWFRKKFHGNALPEAEEVENERDELEKGSGIFSTHFLKRDGGRIPLLGAIGARTFQRGPEDVAIVSETALDAAPSVNSIKGAFTLHSLNVTDNQLAYFGSQGFIGYQLMAIIAQNWLVLKACKQPAKDAIRNGFKVATDDATVVPVEVLAYIDKCDKRYNLTKNLVDFVYFGRIFGIRIAMFDIVSSDPDYYVKPFNPDGITPGSYRGISQIDPYWITPELNGEAASNPASRNFYEPTYWRVNGNRIHRSHLIIFKGDEVADILKPTYLYGGVSITQKIFERVYAAERTANEAPMLAQSKRETVLHVDVEKAIANQAAFEEKIGVWTQWRNNHGVKVVGLKEEVEQFETSLADLDEVIMTQYQLVASTAGVPVTKLLGTVPKGFNSTGEYDESSYHEELESIQTHDMQRLLERHHICVMRSEVRREFPTQPIFNIAIQWNPLDVLTAKEQAEVNKLKADTGLVLVSAGAIDGEDERNRLINDEYSDYNGMTTPEPEIPDDGDETIIN